MIQETIFWSYGMQFENTMYICSSLLTSVAGTWLEFGEIGVRKAALASVFSQQAPLAAELDTAGIESPKKIIVN